MAAIKMPIWRYIVGQREEKVKGWWREISSRSGKEAVESLKDSRGNISEEKSQNFLSFQ